jgi:hypothetical protein
MAWFNIIKDIETATNSAEIWAQNDLSIHRDTIKFIEGEVRGTYNTVYDVTESLAQFLSKRMAQSDGFMEELTGREPSDGLVDVDWRQVAERFSEEISEAMEAYR